MPKSAGKQMSINIIASIVSFAVTVGINFFLTPYLVKERFFYGIRMTKIYVLSN